MKQDPVTDSRPAAPPLRVVAADDSYLIREAIQAVLATSDRVDLVALSEDGDQLWQAVVDEEPDVVIVDIRMPPSGDFEGINIARRMRDEYPDIGLIALSQWAEPSLAVSLLRPSAQGRGYLLKDRLYDRSELLQAIEVIAHGGSVIDPVVVEHLIQGARRPARSPIDELTPREQEVLALDGARQEQRCDRQRPDADQARRREARRLDLHEADARGRERRQSPRGRGADVSLRLPAARRPRMTAADPAAADPVATPAPDPAASPTADPVASPTPATVASDHRLGPRLLMAGAAVIVLAALSIASYLVAVLLLSLLVALLLAPVRARLVGRGIGSGLALLICLGAYVGVLAATGVLIVVGLSGFVDNLDTYTTALENQPAWDLPVSGTCDGGPSSRRRRSLNHWSAQSVLASP